MKTKIFTSILAILFASIAIGQKPSIAVGPIKTYGIFLTPELTSKLARLELIKINKYSVLDEFDINELNDTTDYSKCFGRECLIEYGQKLKVDYMLSGSVEKLGPKIVINLKLIDVNSESVVKNKSIEFADMENEIQRMLGIVIQEMHDIEVDPEIKKRLIYNNELIISNNIGRVNNSGPRIGMAVAGGTLHEFMTRPEAQGGLDILPIVTNIGYQFEAQYVGTENFSALFEFIPMFIGLEQGQFIPTVLILNGFRFGKSGWEFAFGPSLGLNKTSYGFFDTEGIYGLEDRYWTQSEFLNTLSPTPGVFYSNDDLKSAQYSLQTVSDKRGDVEFTTRWIMAFGRSFKSGALNIPVNIFYSSQKNGGMIGFSVGFNITRSKSNIN